VLDFSYPMFNAGLQIMVGRNGSGSAGLFGVFGEVIGFVTASLAKFLVVLLIGLFVVGNLIWLATRRREPKPYLSGLGDGMWKAAAVGLAGDLGTGDARRPAARFLSVAWVIVGVCFVSLFTAAVTSRLTVGQIRTDIAGVSDLNGRDVVTVAGSTAAGYLKDRGIAFRTVVRVEDAYPLLARRKVDAIVFDAPVLQHQATRTPGAVLLVGPVFKPEDYGIAVPLDSTLRKKINATLLDLRADGGYERIYQKYFGVAGS
jgi:polar amino acid transport system substrate-binding protein